VSQCTIRPWYLPYPIAWSLMLAVDLLSLVRKGKPGTARYRLARTLANMRYRCERARQELGWSPRVTLAEGLRRVIESAKERPYPW